MATASKKTTTKENIEVKDKKNESVLESKQSGRSRTKSSTGKSGNASSKTSNKKNTSGKVNITYQRKIQDVTDYRDRLAFETGITLLS